MAEIVLSFTVLAFVFAYLAVNTPKEHGPLQILNYVLTFLTIFFTGYLAYARKVSGQEELLVVWNNAFAWVFYIVVAYFMLYILVKAFKLYKTRK
ncbi:hypothetical protein SAMN05443574_105296 [Haloarcula vallismortis]|uniref:Uncharacterized protein n=2 Tax=Haloarcula vallismortis TaxID=28442 RepID=A0A1H2VH29_HALVA|nr:hypothetical protein [Haloarcula vallismortis]SDW67633.1 hypothetical protein SAMN05443574_105296 [Haloarcula vallismortis]